MEQKELMDLIANATSEQKPIIEMPMELAVRIVYELDKLNKIKETLTQA